MPISPYGHNDMGSPEEWAGYHARLKREEKEARKKMTPAEAYDWILKEVLEHQPEPASVAATANWVRCIIAECYRERAESVRLRRILIEHGIEYLDENAEIEAMDRQQLRPCPFCGSKASMTQVESAGGEGRMIWIVGCNDDDCEVTFQGHARKVDATKAWNARK